MSKPLGFFALLYCALAGQMQGGLLFSTDASWRYFPAVSAPSSPATAWRVRVFDDATWRLGNGPFFYDDPGGGYSGNTDLNAITPPMRNNYTGIFMRKSFVVDDPASVGQLQLNLDVDDGCIVWINGTEVARVNMPAGEIAFNGTSLGSLGDPNNAAFTIPASNLVVAGTNVVAVHALNATLGSSSDFLIRLSLGSTAPDLVAPTISSHSPAPGTINNLTAITVTFSEPVTGLDAADLLVNGQPASSMTGGSDTYTFAFPSPAAGPVAVTWAAGHGIVDFASPANGFNANAPGATWNYTLVDNTPPTVTALIPPAGVTVRSLSRIEVHFTEAVTGLEAGDLLINGSPASGMAVSGPGQYIFTFSQPVAGPVGVQWVTAHGIQDLATPANPFAGGTWSYVLDPNAVVPIVRINEFLAANISGLRDSDNEPQDWIELYNDSPNAVSLAGWSLSDDADDPEKWIFPAVQLGPRQYLVIFCSGKDRRPVSGQLHTNLKLSPDGDFLGLYNNEFPRQAVSLLDPYPAQRGDYSYGLDSSAQWRYYRPSTPGATNGASNISGIVADTRFSHDRGFYATNFSLTITSATPGVTIRYTLDGTAPTGSVGLIYSTPIPITRTTVVRAMASKAGLLETDIDCHTYLFLNDVITQASNGQAPPGWPTSWGANVVDYGMDPDIVNNPAYSGTIRDDLKSIPTFSIVMKLDDLFHASTGIYANPGQDGSAWERACSVELINPEGGDGFQINAGIRIRGGFSRSTENPKHAFRLFFRQEYGASKLNYPLFGVDGAKSFDKFDLRTFQNYSWSFQGDSRGVFLRDQLARDQQLAMGRPATRGDFYHLYINGMYWGIYNSEERSEASWGESYFGGREEDYDVIKTEAGPYTINATDGNMDAWTRLWRAATNGFSNDADYFRVQGLNVDGTPNPAYENLLDVPNLIDYMLVILWGGNLDAPISNFLQNNSPNNWYGLRNRDGLHGGFRFAVHDSEHTLLNVTEDRTGPYVAGDPARGSTLSKSNPQYIWTKLQANAEFRMLVADHVQRHFFNGGVFTPEIARNMFMTRSNQIYRAVVGESARWGDAKVATPYTRNVTWVSAIRGVYDSFLGPRGAVVLNQLRADALFPNVAAPTISHPGGVIPAGYSLTLNHTNATGTIFYTLDGRDPRLRGGAVAPGAIAYAGPITLNFPAHVKARVRSGAIWSALSEAEFFTEQDFAGLVVSEIMYNPPALGGISGDEFEFLELKNNSDHVLDLGGISFSGISFTFTNETRLAPGAFFVLARNAARLTAQHPGLVINGIYTGRLDNGGETLTLTHPLGGQLLRLNYSDDGRWPITADGHGYSLVVRDPAGRLSPSGPSNWRASSIAGGSPGADDPEPTIAPVVINEILTHTDLPAVDSIELYNPTDNAVDLSGWFLTDDSLTLQKFRIRDGMSIPAHGYLVFTEEDFNSPPGTNNSFTLSSLGEEVYLLSGGPATMLTGYSHGFNFGAAPNGETFGRYVISTGAEHYPAQITPTLDGTNSGPRVGPIVISQIMYHPPDLAGGADNGLEEYVELRNISDHPVQLFDAVVPTNTWKLRDAIDFNFPANVTVAPGGAILVVSFNPQDSAARTAFQTRYPLFTGRPLYGPYTGKLDNSTESLELARPDSANVGGEVPFILVDRVEYTDAAPWPPAADGVGAALQRVSLTSYGNDPANWVSAAPLTIQVQPQGLTVSPSNSVTLSVIAIGTGNMRYQWRRGGASLAGETNATLEIASAGENHQGFYSVLVSDQTGAILSTEAFLSVLVEPYIIQAPLDQSVSPGGTVTFSVTVGGNLPIGFRWRRGGTSLASSVLYSHTSFLTISNVQSTNVGSYSVVVTNAAAYQPGIVSPIGRLTLVPDADADKLPDAWETAHGLNSTNSSDALLDNDGDGMSNHDEYTAGTDPRDSLSYLRVTRIAARVGAEISFPAMSNKTYTVEFAEGSPNTSWSRLGDVVASSTNRTAVVFDPEPSQPRYYRIMTPRRP